MHFAAIASRDELMDEPCPCLSNVGHESTPLRFVARSVRLERGDSRVDIAAGRSDFEGPAHVPPLRRESGRLVDPERVERVRRIDLQAGTVVALVGCGT